MSEWISVKERLPEDPRQECIVLWEGFDILYADIATLSDIWNGKRLWRGQRGSHNQVKFWMPLPPPPSTT